MTGLILLVGLVMLTCILLLPLVDRLPVPSLLCFLGLGMLFGENGLFHIPFDDYELVSSVCTLCLIAIMFYGGFGTRLAAARPVLLPAMTLSFVGVLLTALGVAAAAHVLLSLSWKESFLIGAVISSTDAASVFNVLRSRKLALKDHTDSLLELESGSNDPMSFILTTTAISLLSGEQISVPLLLAGQILIGAAAGLLLGTAGAFLLRRRLLARPQSRTIFLLSLMLLSYALPGLVGGNGYLAVYLCGIRTGNASIGKKADLVHFFDVTTDVAQMMIFFLLGLLVTPADLPQVFLPALVVMISLTFLVRPLACAVILLPFKASRGQYLVTAFAGLRGAASIVFAIEAVLSAVPLTYNLYNLVFVIVLLSLVFQGSLLPCFAGRAGMVDPAEDVARTFTDFEKDSDIVFLRLNISEGDGFSGRTLTDLRLPRDLSVCVVVRDGAFVSPAGDTLFAPGDFLVLTARQLQTEEGSGTAAVRLAETVVERNSPFAHRTLAELGGDAPGRIVLVRRGEEALIPDGSLTLLPGDGLVQVEKAAE